MQENKGIIMDLGQEYIPQVGLVSEGQGVIPHAKRGKEEQIDEDADIFGGKEESEGGSSQQGTSGSQS